MPYIVPLYFISYIDTVYTNRNFMSQFSFFIIVLRGTIISDRNERKIETELTRQLGIPPLTYVHYDALVSRVYKGFKKISKVIGMQDSFLFRIPIHISQSAAMCGFELKKNTKYLIMGRIVTIRKVEENKDKKEEIKEVEQLQVTHCSFIQELHEVSHEVRRGINGQYNCDCNVQPCYDGYCERQGEGCKWHVQWDGPVDECTIKHKTCKPVNFAEDVPLNNKTKKNGSSQKKCQWTEDTIRYNKCVKKTKLANALKN